MERILNQARSLIASIICALPRFKGLDTLTWIVNKTFLTLGANPIVRTPVNGVSMCVDLRTFTEFGAFWRREYDNVQIKNLGKILQTLEKPVFLDIGANIGFYSVAIARSVAPCGGRVFAFEPHPSNYARLVDNTNENKLDNVKVFNIGVSSTTGKLNLVMREDFELGSDTGNCSIEIADGQDANSKKIQIELEPLDSFASSHHIERVDVMKVDVEGHEDEVFKGAYKLLVHHRPIIQIEVNRVYFNRKGVDFDAKLPELLPPNYLIYRQGKGGLVKTASLYNCSNLTDILLCPIEKAHLLDSIR